MFRNKAFALLILLPTFSGAEEYPFDRLFTSNDERAMLDRWRDQPNVNLQSVNTETTSPLENTRTVAPDIVLSGYIIREDGKSVVWVNGKSELSPDHEQDRIRTSTPKADSESVYVSRDDVFARMKPGQVWSVNDKKVKEAYEALPVKPAIKEIEPSKEESGAADNSQGTKPGLNKDGDDSKEKVQP